MDKLSLNGGSCQVERDSSDSLKVTLENCQANEQGKELLKTQDVVELAWNASKWEAVVPEDVLHLSFHHSPQPPWEG